MQRKIKGSAGLGDLKDTLNGKPIRNHLTGIPAGSEGLCGPRAPAPKAFGLWTPIAELAYRWYPSWFPHKREGTRKPGMAAFGFWPGGEAANPDALHPGKAWEQSAGESYFPPRIFPGFLGPEAHKLFVTPARLAEAVDIPNNVISPGVGPGTKHGQPPVADVLSVLRSAKTSNLAMKASCDD